MSKKKTALTLKDGDSREIIIYRDANNAPKVEVLFQQGNLWLSQKSIAILFDVGVPAIAKHIKNIYEQGGNCFKNGNSSTRGHARGATSYRFLQSGPCDSSRLSRQFRACHYLQNMGNWGLKRIHQERLCSGC